MGIIIAKFRKQKSTYEVLEKLEDEITAIEEFSRATENTKKKIVGRFIVMAVSTYMFLAIGLYLYYHKISPNQKLVYTIPLIAVPVVIYVIKSFLSWYYSRKIGKNQSKLIKLKGEKKKILERVEETETYKVAKKILEKFGDANKKPSIAITTDTPSVASKTAIVPFGTAVKPAYPGPRQRTALPPTIKNRLSFGSLDSNYPTPTLTSMPRIGTPVGRVPGYSVTPNISNLQSATNTAQMTRSILPKNRTVLDKMFDYLVGDGPSNRYALICKSCSSHNGMALKEEFEYLSFKCCYCGFFNPSIKKRLSGPKFEAKPSTSRIQTTHSSDSDASSEDSDKNSTKTAPNVNRGDSTDGLERTSDFEKLSDAEIKESAQAVSPQVGRHLDDQINQTLSSMAQDCGDMPASQTRVAEESRTTNAFEGNLYPSGDGKNPFESDTDNEISNTPMEVENVITSEAILENIDVTKIQKTKGD